MLSYYKTQHIVRVSKLNLMVVTLQHNLISYHVVGIFGVYLVYVQVYVSA